MRIAIVGGDRRALYAARAFESKGIHCLLFGLDELPEGNCVHAAKEICSAPYLLKEALKNADALLLPLPVSKDGVSVFSPFSSRKTTLEELFPLINKGTPVFGGALPEKIKDGFPTFDFLCDENFAQNNALPTAEGALGLALLHHPGVLYASRCAVFGYGRIARRLTLMLLALGAHVTVYARRESARAEAEKAGAEALSFEDLPLMAGEYDLMFNTVPFPFTGNAASSFSPDALYIELASAPYGIKEEEKKRLPCAYLSAPGLPGIYSPKYAGELIAKTVLEMAAHYKTNAP